MSVRLFSASISGIDAQLIEVEVDSTPGLHSFNIVGLPDKAVEESKERIASAIRNNSLLPPSAKHKKIVINLAPADIRKEGPAYDLPIAVGYLLETGQVKFDPAEKVFLGELSLTGTIKPVNGILSAALMAKDLGFKEVIVPIANAREAAAVGGLRVLGCSSLTELTEHLSGMREIKPMAYKHSEDTSPEDGEAFRLIKGQEAAKRALMVAAAGGHNILMSGPPGSGKTLLAKALVDLMPSLSFSEALEVTRVYSSLGLVNGRNPILSNRPFRSPHHTSSAPAMVGGGSSPKPGEISLSHRGILFLDELPEFPRHVLESLREPLEEGMITVSRASGSVRLPAKFTLVGAMNPCPCGNYGDSKAICVCSPINVIRYRKKISGPLLDRIDIQVNVPRETVATTKQPISLAAFQDIKNKIGQARMRQLGRFAKSGIFTNAEITYRNIDKWCVLDRQAEAILQQAAGAKSLSLRSYHKIKKLSRTIADLDGAESIGKQHVAEAISLKINEKLLGELGN